MNIIKKIAAAGALALVLAGCSGGINSEEEAIDVLQNSNSHEERMEAVEYLMEQGSSVEEAMAVPAPVTIEINEPVDVTFQMINAVGGQVRDDLSDYDGDPRIIRVSADVTNTSDESLAIPEWGVGFDAYEGAGQFPVDSYAGYFDHEDITHIERMPTLIQPGETVEFANSYVFTMDDNWTITFEWNDDEGRTATETLTVD